MPFSLNKIQLLGRIGKDPEIKFSQNNTEILTFPMATEYSYKGKDGNYVNETNWHNIVAFNVSEFYKNNIKKGKRIYLEGRVNTRSYEDQQGQKKFFTEVVADNFSIIPIDADKKGESNFNESKVDYNQDTPQTNESDTDLPF